MAVFIRVGLQIAEAAGNATLLAVSIIQDPNNAFEAVFTTLAGAGLSRGSWTKAADERRGLSDADSRKLGSIHLNLTKIKIVRDGVCTL